jgi:sulfate transport system ATP-binding protein
MSITAKNVCKRFGAKLVLDHVTVEAPSGSLVALLGPSGSGKTTLLRIIAGLEVPDAGTVHYLDDDVTHHSARERNIGFVFQHYALFRHMTVFENVAFGLRVRKWPDERVRKRVAELLHLVRLDEYADRYPATLSGGQKQRIALVRASPPSRGSCSWTSHSGPWTPRCAVNCGSGSAGSTTSSTSPACS